MTILATLRFRARRPPPTTWCGPSSPAPPTWRSTLTGGPPTGRSSRPRVEETATRHLAELVESTAEQVRALRRHLTSTRAVRRSPGWSGWSRRSRPPRQAALLAAVPDERAHRPLSRKGRPGPLASLSAVGLPGDRLPAHTGFSTHSTLQPFRTSLCAQTFTPSTARSCSRQLLGRALDHPVDDCDHRDGDVLRREGLPVGEGGDLLVLPSLLHRPDEDRRHRRSRRALRASLRPPRPLRRCSRCRDSKS